ncbi:MAG: stage II sporulation protein D [Oscillospiraceae bacterium]|nr:stage II sporulation protein D [Oscillospiraceae bacterium]
MLIKNYLVIIAVFAALMLSVPVVSMFKTNLWDAERDNGSEKSSTSGTSSGGNGDQEQTADEIAILDHKTNEVFTIPVREYIIGVVFAEIPPTYETEAIKAQAVAAHSYARRHMELQNQSPSDELKGAALGTNPANFQAYLTNEEIRERYKDNYDEYYKKISECVDEVYDKIMVFEGQIIVAAFHAYSHGRTVPAMAVWGTDIPYLQSVDSELDMILPNDTVEISAAETERILKEAYEDIEFPEFRSDWFRDIDADTSGYVVSLMAGNTKLSGVRVRELFSLRSAAFTVDSIDDNFVFISKGYGHGVGLSQFGANAMAMQGKTHQEILKHYYSGIEITTF